MKYLSLCLLALSFIFSCKKDTDSTPETPALATVRIDSVGSISFTSAKIYAATVAEGKTAITAAGIAWGTAPDPTVFVHNIPASGFGVGQFSVEIPRLSPGVTYFVRSYATNTAGTVYSAQKTFVTSPAALPVLTTSDVSAIAINTATGGGNITSEGSGAVIERGICWGTAPNPVVVSDNKVLAGIGTGSFTAAISGLAPGTKYYVRAYATNAAGTGYGSEVNFTTIAIITDVDGNIYNPVIIGTQTWMKENLKVSKYRNGDPIGTDWSMTAGAYAVYKDSAYNNETYGKLYNGYAVADPRGLCPVGWHVPTDNDWKILETHLGMPAADVDMEGVRGESQNIGGKLKAISLWDSPNTGATNESGFSALPGGIGHAGFNYYEYLGLRTLFWTQTDANTHYLWTRGLQVNKNWISRYYISLGDIGYSVRCVKD